MSPKFSVLLGLAACTIAVTALFWNRTSKPINLDEIKVKAQNLQRLGEWQAVIDLLHQVPEGSFAKPRALLEQGRAYWELANGPAMERTLKQCIAAERTPEQPSDITLAAWGTLGDHYLGQERFEEAKEAIWYVFDSNTRRGNPDPFYLELLLRTRFESTDPSVAIEQLQKFLDTDPNDADAHRAMGIYRARLHENDLARQHLLRALEGNSQVPRFLDAWLWFLLLTGDMEQVGQVVAQLPPACDSYPDFWVYRSKWAMHQRDWSTAIQYLERALQFEPGRLDANNLYLRCLRRTDRIQDAENVSNRLKILTQAYTEIANLFGVLNSLNGKPPEPQTCAELSKWCKVLHWDREAEAWEAVRAKLATQ